MAATWKMLEEYMKEEVGTNSVERYEWKKELIREEKKGKRKNLQAQGRKGMLTAQDERKKIVQNMKGRMDQSQND